MSIVSKPNTFSANTTASSSQVNDNFDTIYNEFNGNISAANLATGAVTTAKVADSNITTAKINDSAVTTAKLNDLAVTTGKLADGAVTPAKRTGGFYAGVWDASGVGTGAGKTITGIGFTPKTLIILGHGESSTGGALTTSGYCYFDGSTYVQGHQASGMTTTAGRTLNSTTQAFASTTQSTTQFIGAVTGFSSDTITVNVTTNVGSATYCKFHIMVFG